MGIVDIHKTAPFIVFDDIQDAVCGNPKRFELININMFEDAQTGGKKLDFGFPSSWPVSISQLPFQQFAIG